MTISKVVSLTLFTSLNFLILQPCLPTIAYATETKAEETLRHTQKSAKKAGRAIKDETCTWVKGKMECAGEKIQHKVNNATDEVKDKIDDTKN